MEKKLWKHSILPRRDVWQTSCDPCDHLWLCHVSILFLFWALSLHPTHYLKREKSELIFRHAEPREGIRKGGRGKSLAHKDSAGGRHLHHRLVSSLLQWWLLLGADQDRQDRERNNCEGLVQPAAHHQHSPTPVQRLLSGQGKNLHPQILSDFHRRDLPDFLFHAFDFDTN